MQSGADNFIPILFMVLFGFIGLNIIVNLVLLYTQKQRINKFLALYWPVLLVYFLIQGIFQNGQLNIVLAFSAAVPTMLIMAIIGFEVMGKKMPIKTYLMLFLPMYPLTFFLNQLGFGFIVVAMPFAVAAMIPILHVSVLLIVINYQTTTRLQKVLGVIYFLQSIHCINFALFRMNPGAQLWGWLVTYALCDLLAIILPSIALELAGINERERLKRLVAERTLELQKSVKTNEDLFKVLIHDISSPLMVIKSYCFLLKEEREDKQLLLDRISEAGSIIEKIVVETKTAYLKKDS